METTNLDSVTKNFFKKPEGKTGIAILVILGGAFLFGLYKILPYLITLAQNTLHLILLIVGIVAVVGVISSKEFRINVWAGYQVVMRKITGFFIELDPVAIAKAYIQELKKFRQKAEEKIGLLRGHIENLAARIEANKSSIEDSLRRAKIIRDSDDFEEDVKLMKVAVQARAATRAKDSNVRLYDMLIKMKKVYRALTKLHQVSGILVEDLENQVTNMIQEWEAAKAAGSALRSTINAMRGNADKRAIFEMAFDKMQGDISKQIGEFQTFLDFSGDLIENVDLDNAMFAEEGLKMLDEFEEKGFEEMMKTFENAMIEKQNEDPSQNTFTSFQRKNHLIPLERNLTPTNKQPRYKIL